jgi:hypothetical protein
MDKAKNRLASALRLRSENKFPLAEDFMLDVPLYRKIAIDLEDEAVLEEILKLEYYGQPLDVFCLECGKRTSFLAENDMPGIWVPDGVFGKMSNVFELIDMLQACGSFGVKLNFDNPNLKVINPSYGTYTFFHLSTRPRRFTVKFKCPHDTSHKMYFDFNVYDSVIEKVGQYPSISDLQEAGLRQYRAVLSNEKYRELTRAVGLASHGVGIGAFVYLRRLFEDAVKDAHDQAALSSDWDDAAYLSDRMDGKIGLLKDHLPEFLYDNRKMYSILSKGLHELTEDECLEYFPVLKTGIELILDQKLEQKRRADKILAASKAIKKIVEGLS